MWLRQSRLSRDYRRPVSNMRLGGFFGELRRRLVLGRLGHERGLEPALDRLLGYDALLHVAPRGELELHLEERLFEDRPQPALAGLAFQRAVGDRDEGFVGEHELDSVELEEALELLDERVARLGEDRDEIVARELVDHRDHGQAADELGDQAVVHEVLGQDLLEELARVLVRLGPHRRAEADPLVTDAALDHLVEVREGAAADEEDVRCVDREELLVRVLAPALRRHRGDGALEDLQERLLHALARHVAGDRRVVGLPRDLVDLVDVDDPGLGLLDVEVRGLDQLQEDVLDVLTDVAGLGERRRIGDREADVEDPRQRLRQQRLTATRRTKQQDVRLLELDLPVLGHHLNALVVVVDRDRERPLRFLLRDDVVVKDVVDVLRLRQVLEIELRGSRQLLVDDLVAEIDALVANVDAGTGDQLLDLPLGLAAEAAEKLLVAVGCSGHGSPFTPESPRPLVPRPVTPPSFWVASTKPEAALARRQG